MKHCCRPAVSNKLEPSELMLFRSATSAEEQGYIVGPHTDWNFLQENIVYISYRILGYSVAVCATFDQKATEAAQTSDIKSYKLHKLSRCSMHR